ncbi:MAG: metalloprotease PmbA [Panacagrimonas sp.]
MTTDAADGLPETESLAMLAERVLEMARRKGASQAELSLSHARGLSLNVRNAEVESLEFQRDRGLSLTVFFGHRRGSASSGDLSDDGLEDCVSAACEIAKATEEDPCAGLAQAERMATEMRSLALDHPWPISADEAIERARACEAAALSVDRRIQQCEGASLSTHRGVSIYANSHGFFGPRSGTQHSLSCSVVAADDKGMQRDYWYDSHRSAQSLQSPESIGRQAAQRTVRRLGAKTAKTAQVPVLFAPEVARSLFGHFVGAISGAALYRQASFLLDKLDQPVFSPTVGITQQPFIQQAAASSCFDSEGVATHERTLVEQGILKGWLLGSYSARRLGLETTGNAGGVYNLMIEPGEQDFASLLKDLDEGLWITELMGHGTNMVTGDYSRGAAGFWVKGGEIIHPVEGVTVASNLLQMFANIRAIGNDVDTRGGTRCGSVLIDGMTMAAES